MTDAFATWDDAIAAGHVSDDPDGLPDRAIIPLVEDLRAAGIVTLQSCAGHTGSADGVLWVREEGTWPACVGDLLINAELFTEIKFAYHPERRWEIGWLPQDAGMAMARIRETFLP